MVAVLGVDEAAAALERGEVVAVPTDTVYGLAARFADSAAVASVFALKHRPATVALPVLVASSRQIEELGVTWPLVAQALEETLWPGALTIVVSVPQDLASRVGATDAIGFRAPASLQLLELLERVGPLCVTSANEHGEPPCTTAQDVSRVFEGSALAGVLDSGRRDGAVSTVIALSSEGWRLLRDGAIPASALRTLLGADPLVS